MSHVQQIGFAPVPPVQFALAGHGHRRRQQPDQPHCCQTDSDHRPRGRGRRSFTGRLSNATTLTCTSFIREPRAVSFLSGDRKASISPPLTVSDRNQLLHPCTNGFHSTVKESPDCQLDSGVNRDVCRVSLGPVLQSKFKIPKLLASSTPRSAFRISSHPKAVMKLIPGSFQSRSDQSETWTSSATNFTKEDKTTVTEIRAGEVCSVGYHDDVPK